MAWKLRKDKLQEDAPTEGPSLADTAAPQEPVSETRAYASEPDPRPFDTVQAELHPLVFDMPEPASDAGVEESLFAPSFLPDSPFVLNGTDEITTSTGVEEPRLVIPEPVFTFGAPSFVGTAPAPEAEVAGLGGVEEPHLLTPGPEIAESALLSGPFAPFQPDEVTAPDAPTALDAPAEEHPFLILDREEVAQSLVHSEPASEVPRVAPFIVDVPPTAEPAPLPGTLNVRIGNFSARFDLTKDVTVIGRPDSLLQSYPDVEIELDDAVSRRHAEIRHSEGGYALVDLRSTNGTLLNGERLVPHREYLLEQGDRINLGDRTEILFE